MEKLMDNALALRGIQALPIVTIFRPANAIEFVQNAELLVEQRLLGKHLLASKISAIARHAQNKVLGALVLIDHGIPVPRRDRRIFHAGLTLGPLESMVAVFVLGSIFRRQRSHIVRNTERNQTLDLCSLVLKERIEAALVFENGLQLLKMQLIVDGTVITRLKATQKALFVECVHHGDIALIRLRTRSRKELLYGFSKVIIGQFMQVICGVTLCLRGIVVARGVIAVRIVIGCAAEERLI